MSNVYSVTSIPEERIYRVTNPGGGPTLTFSMDSGVQLLEVQDGPYLYAFKDLNRNGKIPLPLIPTRKFCGRKQAVNPGAPGITAGNPSQRRTSAT